MYLVLRPVLKCHSQGYYSVTTSKQNRPGVSAARAEDDCRNEIAIELSLCCVSKNYFFNLNFAADQ